MKYNLFWGEVSKALSLFIKASIFLLFLCILCFSYFLLHILLPFEGFKHLSFHNSITWTRNMDANYKATHPLETNPTSKNAKHVIIANWHNFHKLVEQQHSTNKVHNVNTPQKHLTRVPNYDKPAIQPRWTIN